MSALIMRVAEADHDRRQLEQVQKATALPSTITCSRCTKLESWHVGHAGSTDCDSRRRADLCNTITFVAPRRRRFQDNTPSSLARSPAEHGNNLRGEDVQHPRHWWLITGRRANACYGGLLLLQQPNAGNEPTCFELPRGIRIRFDQFTEGRPHVVLRVTHPQTFGRCEQLRQRLDQCHLLIGVARRHRRIHPVATAPCLRARASACSRAPCRRSRTGAHAAHRMREVASPSQPPLPSGP